MGKQLQLLDSCTGTGDGGAGDVKIHDWELGLPDLGDLTPLSQALIPAELASAFNISPEPYRTFGDLNRAFDRTMSTMRSYSFKSYGEINRENDVIVEIDEEERSDSKKLRRSELIEEVDSVVCGENSNSGDDSSTKTLKRPHLVWTPQLHKRFVEVVAHLGIKNAVPKTIMQMMNVEGLTRENVASHLQKYRLYLKRMQGISTEGPSSCDQLFASTPVPQSLHDGYGHHHHAHHHFHQHHYHHGDGYMPIAPFPMPYGMMPMAGHGNGSMGKHMGNCIGFESHQVHLPYNIVQLRDWSGNK